MQIFPIIFTLNDLDISCIPNSNSTEKLNLLNWVNKSHFLPGFIKKPRLSRLANLRVISQRLSTIYQEFPANKYQDSISEELLGIFLAIFYQLDLLSLLSTTQERYPGSDSKQSILI